MQHCSRQAAKTMALTSGVEYAPNIPAARKTNANGHISCRATSTQLSLRWITPLTISKAKYVKSLPANIHANGIISDVATKLPITAEFKGKPRRRNGIPVQHGTCLRDDAEWSDQPVVQADQRSPLPVHGADFGYFVQQ